MRAIGKNYELSGIVYRNVPGQGLVQEEIYHGTPNGIGQVRGGLNASVYEFDHAAETSRHELRVRRPPAFKGVPGQFTLELRESINVVHKDILEPAPDAPPGLAGLTEDDIADLRRIADGQAEPEELLSLSPEALAVSKLILRGVKDRIVYQPVFTIQRVSDRSHVWPNQTNGVGRIFSDGQMIEDQGLEGLITWTLASTAYAADIEPDGFSYGWLKMMPNHDTVVGNRSSQTVEFHFGLWALLLFKLA